MENWWLLYLDFRAIAMFIGELVDKWLSIKAPEAATASIGHRWLQFGQTTLITSWRHVLVDVRLKHVNFIIWTLLCMPKINELYDTLVRAIFFVEMCADDTRAIVFFIFVSSGNSCGCFQICHICAWLDDQVRMFVQLSEEFCDLFCFRFRLKPYFRDRFDLRSEINKAILIEKFDYFPQLTCVTHPSMKSSKGPGIQMLLKSCSIVFGSNRPLITVPTRCFSA